MAPTRMMSEIDFAKTQLAVFFVIMLLAVDTINPVKIFLHVFPTVAPWHVATVSFLLMLYVFISEMKELLYFSVKIFFHSILSIFFRNVEIIGKDNIPRHGPVIFTSNHANQFIDSVVVLCTCQHKISYLLAEKSWKRRIIGDIAWAMGTVPVKRAQDSAKPGSGTVLLKEVDAAKKEEPTDGAELMVELLEPCTPRTFSVSGNGTKFTSELRVKDKIRIQGCAIGLKVISIESDESMQVDGSELPSDFETPTAEVVYDTLERIDQKVVFEKVLDKLVSGGTIGIFPEGGSHDRTDLLPLKAGVALIAYSALEKDGMNVPIVPVGLNYFRGYRFRGRVIVEFGRPTYIDPNTLSDYVKGGPGRRKVCNDLLDSIEDSMRSVIVSTPDYRTLQLIHTARRLYQRKEQTASQKQDLSRRFAEGYKQLLLLTKGNPPKEWLELQDRMRAYQKELNDLGIRDYQVLGLDREKYDYDRDSVLREMQLPYYIAHLFVLFLLALLPAVLLNLPVGMVARLYANQRRKTALAQSKVKVKGVDVLLSEKVLLCIILVPSLWMTYGLILYFCTNLDAPAIALAVFCMPLFSYTGIMVTEAGMVDLRDLKPFVMRLLPSARRRLAALPAVRHQLQIDLRDFIREIGPSLGEIYHGKNLDWAAIQSTGRKPIALKNPSPLPQAREKSLTKVE